MTPTTATTIAKAVFSICAPNYLARTAALMDSVARHLPQHERFVLVAAQSVSASDAAMFPAGTQLLTPRDIEAPALDVRRRLYNVTEFCTSIKPDVFMWLLNERGYGQILYFDPDIVVFQPLGEIAAAFDSGAEIVVTPHIVSPGRHPDWVMRAVSLSGQFNLGFLGIRRSPVALEALGWWRDRIAFGCIEDAAKGIFVDQKETDFFVSLFPAPHVIRDAGYNVAYWNLHERRLSHEDGRYCVETWRNERQPLSFFHFSGFELFGSGISRHLADKQVPKGALGIILDGYAKSIVAKGELSRMLLPYDYHRLPGGTRSSPMLRHCLRQARLGDGTRDGSDSDLLDPRYLSDLVWKAGTSAYGAPVPRLLALLDRHAIMPEPASQALKDYLEADPAERKRRVMPMLVELHRNDLLDVRLAEQIAGTRKPDALRWLETSKPIDLYEKPATLSLADPPGSIELPAFLLLLHFTRQDLRDAFDLSTMDGVIDYAGWFLKVGLSNWNLPDAALDAIANGLDRVRLPGETAGGTHDGTLLDAAILSTFSAPAAPGKQARSTVPATAAAALGAILATGRRPPLKSHIARTLRVWIWNRSVAGIPRIIHILRESADLRRSMFGTDGIRRITTASINGAFEKVGLEQLVMPAQGALAQPGRSGSGRAARMEPTVDAIIIGPFASASGVGQSALGVRRLLERTGRRVESRELLHRAAAVEADVAPRLLLLHANADVTLDAAVKFHDLWARAERRVGYWYWELPAMTERMAASAMLLDEIWVATEFTRQAIAPTVRVPVRVVPPAIASSTFAPSDPSGGSFGASKEGFRFLGVVDARSFVGRKNPLGIVRAFRHAFPKGDEAVELVVKLSNGHHNEEGLASFRDLAAGDRRIRVIDGTFCGIEMNDLYQSADCFVSLHRAEGLGLGIVQAMMREKPVIATGFSGPMDFMSTTNAFVVPFRLVPVEPDAYPDWLGQEWAEPDESAAAVYMKELARDPEAARGIRRRARIDAEAFFSVARITAQLRQQDVRRQDQGQTANASTSELAGALPMA